MITDLQIKEAHPRRRQGKAEFEPQPAPGQQWRLAAVPRRGVFLQDPPDPHRLEREQSQPAFEEALPELKKGLITSIAGLF